MEAMILKERQGRPDKTPQEKAGALAEQQMAHYLRRAFGEHADIHVLHDLRLQHAGETAQIDHLVLHRAGIILIESKSVTSAIRVNAREEWARQWDGEWRGMASPLLQGRRQADLLLKLLDAHSSELRSRVLGVLQGGFGAFPVDVLVAISDSGLVSYERELPQVAGFVKKADQIPDRVVELIRHHRKLALPLPLSRESLERGLQLPDADFSKTCEFLLARHTSAGQPTAAQPAAPASKSRPRRQAQAAPAPSKSPQAQPTCRQCGSAHLEIRFGHSYYFKCLDCQGNTPIHQTCSQCGQATRTRKQGPRFYAECSGCGTSQHFFTNP